MLASSHTSELRTASWEATDSGKFFLAISVSAEFLSSFTASFSTHDLLDVWTAEEDKISKVNLGDHFWKVNLVDHLILVLFCVICVYCVQF